jgi:hypothetical protein
LESDPDLVEPLLNEIFERIRPTAGGDVQWCHEMELGLRESILNAIYHGNLELSSELWRRDANAFAALASARRQQPPYCERDVEVKVQLTDSEVVVTVRDQGSGFDISLVGNPCDAENLTKPCGRGIILMQNCVDRVIFNGIGNAVKLVKRFQALKDVA